MVQDHFEVSNTAWAGVSGTTKIPLHVLQGAGIYGLIHIAVLRPCSFSLLFLHP